MSDKIRPTRRAKRVVHFDGIKYNVYVPDNGGDDR